MRRRSQRTLCDKICAAPPVLFSLRLFFFICRRLHPLLLKHIALKFASISGFNNRWKWTPKRSHYKRESPMGRRKVCWVHQLMFLMLRQFYRFCRSVPTRQKEERSVFTFAWLQSHFKLDEQETHTQAWWYRKLSSQILKGEGFRVGSSECMTSSLFSPRSSHSVLAHIHSQYVRYYHDNESPWSSTESTVHSVTRYNVGRGLEGS